MIALGRQIIIEMYNADIKALSSAEIVKDIFLEAAKESRSTVLWSYFHPFEPQGVSGVVVIAESHFTIHTWPEHRYAAIDIFVCSEDVLVSKAIEVFKTRFKTNDIIITGELNRGLLSTDNSLEIPAPMSISQPELYTMSLYNKFVDTNSSAISITINLHEVSKDIDTDLLLAYIDKINQEYNFNLSKDFTTVKKDGDILSYYSACDTASLNFHFNDENDSVFIDVYSEKFIEPRKISESSLYFFGAKNYSYEFFFRK